MPLFRIRSGTLKWVILCLQVVAVVIAFLWALSMGMLWFLSPISLFAAMGFMMIVSAFLMVVPIIILAFKFSKISAAVTGIINAMWILFASLPAPAWILVVLFNPWSSRQAATWLTITSGIDLLSVVIILLCSLFFMKGYIIEDVHESQPSSNKSSEILLSDTQESRDDELDKGDEHKPYRYAGKKARHE